MTKQQALNILKPENNTKDGLKQAYRIACKKYHPDHGGDIEMMKMVNEAWEFLKKCSWSDSETAEAVNDEDIIKEVFEKWQAMKSWVNIRGEVVGTWIWVDGQTWRYKKQLKEMGFRWSPNKRRWYWHPAGYKKKSRKQYSMNDIRNMFGSKDLESELNAALA